MISCAKVSFKFNLFKGQIKCHYSHTIGCTDTQDLFADLAGHIYSNVNLILTCESKLNKS